MNDEILNRVQIDENGPAILLLPPTTADPSSAIGEHGMMIDEELRRHPNPLPAQVMSDMLSLMPSPAVPMVATISAPPTSLSMPGLAPSSIYMIPASTGMNGCSSAAMDPGALYEIKRCTIHPKPQLNCKYCRKYKSAVHQQARFAKQQEALKIERDTDDDDDDVVLEMTNSTSYNVNNLLRENILHSEYFKSLYGFTTFEEIVNEIANYADHAEPYVSSHSRAPSTLFCCLYKLFTMRLKELEVQTLLDHAGSPFVRCCGLLYLRYVHPPDKLLDWFRHYLLDDEAFTPGSDKQRKVTIGEFAEKLLAEDRFFNTVLPRIPVRVKAQNGPQLLALTSHRKRKERNKERLDEFHTGTPVAACCEGEWIQGSVESLEAITKGQLCVGVRFEDETEELVDLGLVILLDAKVRQEKRREERDIRRAARGLPKLDYTRRRTKEEKERRRREEEEEEDSDQSARESSRPGESHRSRESHRLKRRHHSRSLSQRCGTRSEGSSRETLQHDARGSQRHQESRPHSKTERRREEHRRDEGRDRRRGKDTEKDYRTSRRPASPVLVDQPKWQTEQELMEEFRRREREKALATGKDYARRPASYKSALSIKFDGPASCRRGRSQSPIAQRVDLSTGSSKEEKIIEPPRKGPSAAYQQKMAALVERYTKPAF